MPEPNNRDHTETEEDDLMIEQIEALAKDIQSRMDSISQDMREFSQRLERLESGGSETGSSESPDRSSERRRICDKLHAREYGSENLAKPICRTCKHSVWRDRSIFQYRNDGSSPDFIRTGYIYCNQFNDQMVLLEAPREECMMKEPDDGLPNQ